MKRLTKRLGVVLLASAVTVALVVTLFEHVHAETPRYGGVLKLIYPKSPRSIGWPSGIAGIEITSVVPCLEPLVRVDNKGLPAPLLATTWEYSPDLKYLTFTLRKGVKFHDSTDFNAEAVKLNLEERKNGIYGSKLKYISSIDVIDEYTVRLNLTEFNNGFIDVFSAHNGLMISPKGIEKAKTRRGKRWVKKNPVGTGPFSFVKFERDVILEYKKFNGYWDKGKPYLDGIELYFNQHPMAAVKSMTDGEVHVTRKISGRQALKLRENGFIIIDYPTGMKSIALDTANPESVYADKRVREAIEYAINRKEIADTLGHGFWHAVNQYSPKNSNGYNPDFTGRPYNPNKAKQLLSEAGYPVGFKTRIIANRNIISIDTLAEIIEDLRKVGIHAVPNIVGAGKYFQLQISGWKDSLMVFSHNMPINITNQLNILFKSDDGQLPSVKRSPELEEVLKNAGTTPDYATQKELTQKAVRMISELSMVIPLWSYNSIIATHASARDLGFGDSNGGLWTPASAWLSE
ncbi:MAG: hypothetical protein JRC68_09115 [Deltaproteobacteria bacterium]|nr:hypothetical protein [Deltaproteobacteria bacterium]